MRRTIRLVIFDLDGTLTPVDSLWSYLHDAFGTWDKGRIAAQRYRKGEISYKEWAETDAQCWAGVSLVTLSEVLGKIPYRTGVRTVFDHLKLKSVKTAIVSAGLSVLANKLAGELDADFAEANDLEVNDGALTGGIRVKVAVDEKAKIIREIAAKTSIPIGEVALVGDRANDLPLEDCLRIAFNPKDELTRERADVIIEDDDLSRILPYLDRELREAY
jgi:phosphoserine phosphatase